MRLIDIAKVCALSTCLVACSEGKKEPSPSEQQPIYGSDISQISAKNQNDLNDARKFLANHLEVVTGQSSENNSDGTTKLITSTYTPSNAYFGAEQWAWKMVGTISIRGDDGFVEAMQTDNISVNPKDLSLPIEIEENPGIVYIKLECYTGKCISQKTNLQIRSDTEGMNQESNTNSLANEVSIPTDSLESANRLRLVILFLLQDAGVKQRRF